MAPAIASTAGVNVLILGLLKKLSCCPLKKAVDPSASKIAPTVAPATISRNNMNEVLS